MKTSIFKQLAVCGVMFALASCIEPNIPGGGDNGGAKYGTLSIPSIGVIEDLRDRNHNQGATRAVSPADFELSITSDADGSEVHNTTYSEFSEITLPVGLYTLAIQSHEHTAPEWDKVHYSLSHPFEIEADTPTELDELVCKVSGILVSVRFTDKMKEAMAGEDYRVEIKIGNCGPLSYENGDERRGNFVAEEENNTLVWDFYGTIDGEEINQSSFIMNVKAGDHRTLTFDTEYVPTGDATFDLDVVVECETYLVNLNVELEEEIVAPLPGGDPDPDPTGEVTIESVGFTFGEALTITQAQAGSVPVKVNIEALEGIENFFVEITSGSAGFNQALEDMYLDEKFDLANPTAEQAIVLSLPIVNLPHGEDVKGETSLEFDITHFVPMIFSYFTGTPFDAEFSLTVIDAKGNSSGKKTIKLHLTE